MKKRPQIEAQVRRNMMVYMKNTTGFRLDYFKGMSYDDIRPIFEAKFNANMEFLLKSKEQMEEEESRAIAIINETPAQKEAKRRRLNKEAEDIKHVNNKPRYKIIRADDTHQLYASFITMLKNFDRDDLETLWSIVKEMFYTSKPNNFSDEYMLTTLKTMFGRSDGQDNVWKSQRSIHGQALVKSWKLLTSCGVHIISFTSKTSSGRADFRVDAAIEIKEKHQVFTAASEDISAARQKLMLLVTAVKYSPRALQIVKDEIFPIVNQVDARVQNFVIHFLKEAAKFVRDIKSLAKEADESLAKHKALELEIKRLLRAVVSQDIMSVVQNNSIGETLNLQTELERTKEQFENCIIKKKNDYAKLWNDWYKKCEEWKFDKISYDKAYNDMQQKIERLQAQLGDLKGKSKDTSCVLDTLNSLSQKLENKNVELEFQLRAQLFDKFSDQKDTTCGTSANTKFAKQSILGKPPKVGETHALSKPVALNSIPTPQGSKFMKNDKVIAQGMFRINIFKPSKEEKHVPNKVRARVRTNPITVSQLPFITKKVVNSDSNGLSSTGVENTKTKRPQLRSNTKNDRVPSASKSSHSKNKEFEVEEHHRKLLLSRNKKHMSSECNNVKLATQNFKYKFVCAICKQCLIYVNHDECLLNYVNGMTSRGKKQKANVSINEKQKKKQPKVKKTKKVGFVKRLASPKPSKPRSFLRWSPTRRMFNLKGKIIASSESENQSDYSKGDNACTSNTLEPTIKRFLNSTFSLAGIVRFVNDRIVVILGFGDLQWGNILITGVYFIKGLGHNLFSVGQFCDSNLEVAFRRNTCFVRNLEGVDLLKGDRSTNLYTINLHEMDSASLICLMARATSTKSWLWHQRLSHFNFDTINDLAKNDLVSGLPKFKYHKEHLCLSCEQGKSKRASHPPKPVPNSRQRLHLLHMDLCGPMRIASINENWYVLVIVNDYSHYTWVQLLKSKDEAPEWNEEIGPCFTQNRSIIHRHFNKTPYELINGRKPDISFLYIFGALCYPKNDREDIGKLGAKGDIGFFIGYSVDSCAFRVYNRRTKKIMEIMNVSFDELSAMAFEQRSSKPRLQSMTSGQISLGVDLTYAPSTITTQQPTEGELDLPFEAMYDDYIGGQPSAALRTVLAVQAHQVRQTLTTSTSIVDTTPTPTNSSSQATIFPNSLQDVDGLNSQQQHAQQQGNQALIQTKIGVDNVQNAMFDANMFVNPFATSSTSADESSSSQYVDPLNIHTFYQPYLIEFQ
uniref:Integrase, catalytic region, zinc finger, CCHC-type, peptidase aspartic, catalytic n=1 Tax=Tanacetum cinerariifolium TaxID=118510 RepID=A0A699I6C6_TANCI|nr:integrase, catalytic region, zinc finger, CCHC-type, peptidase aspartic, catalytic [Tanacetum cinerariifolium]